MTFQFWGHFSFFDILVLVIFQFWRHFIWMIFWFKWHFSFGDISILVTYYPYLEQICWPEHLYKKFVGLVERGKCRDWQLAKNRGMGDVKVNGRNKRLGGNVYSVSFFPEAKFLPSTNLEKWTNTWSDYKRERTHLTHVLQLHHWNFNLKVKIVFFLFKLSPHFTLFSIPWLDIYL